MLGGGGEEWVEEGWGGGFREGEGGWDKWWGWIFRRRFGIGGRLCGKIFVEFGRGGLMVGNGGIYGLVR